MQVEYNSKKIMRIVKTQLILSKSATCCDVAHVALTRIKLMAYPNSTRLFLLLNKKRGFWGL